MEKGDVIPRPRDRWENNTKTGLDEVGWRALTGLIWLRTGIDGRCLWMWYWTFWFHKMWGILWLAEDMLASQEGLCSMGLVSYGQTLDIPTPGNHLWNLQEKKENYCCVQQNDKTRERNKEKIQNNVCWSKWKANMENGVLTCVFSSSCIKMWWVNTFPEYVQT